MDTAAARAVRGVRLVLTHADLGDIRPPGYIGAGGYGFQSTQPMTSPGIAYFGQPIALVVADTLEAALEGASLVRAAYAAEPHSAALDEICFVTVRPLLLFVITAVPDVVLDAVTVSVTLSPALNVMPEKSYA